jgi:hypothetical protein
MYNFRINSGMCKRTIKTETIIQNTFNLNKSTFMLLLIHIVMGATNGAGTAYPSGAPKFIPGF